jgi:hypothetical protein
MRLARPVYEILPFLYMAIGWAAILVSYLDSVSVRAILAFLIGLLAEIAGLTLFLRRLDYRELHRDYPDEGIDRSLR